MLVNLARGNVMFDQLVLMHYKCDREECESKGMRFDSSWSLGDVLFLTLVTSRELSSSG